MTAAVKKRRVTKAITALGGRDLRPGGMDPLAEEHELVPLTGDWGSSSFGLVLTSGGVLATISPFVGAIGVRRGVEQLIDARNEVAASGGPPTPQQARIDKLSARIKRYGRIDLALLLLAVTAMATARYW
jgi:hypothetical protein